MGERDKDHDISSSESDIVSLLLLQKLLSAIIQGALSKTTHYCFFRGTAGAVSSSSSSRTARFFVRCDVHR